MYEYLYVRHGTVPQCSTVPLCHSQVACCYVLVLLCGSVVATLIAPFSAVGGFINRLIADGDGIPTVMPCSHIDILKRGTIASPADTFVYNCPASDVLHCRSLAKKIQRIISLLASSSAES